jgi:hypothetical protein
MEDMQEAVDTEVEKVRNKEAPPFFQREHVHHHHGQRGGPDCLTQKGQGWSQALSDLFWEAKVMIRDFWVVKKHNDKVVSVLVQTSSRYQKILAIGAVNTARGLIGEGLGRAHCRVNVRDAFPREQMEQVQSAYSRGFQLKKEARSKLTGSTIRVGMGQSLRSGLRSMVEPAGGQRRLLTATLRLAERDLDEGRRRHSIRRMRPRRLRMEHRWRERGRGRPSMETATKEPSALGRR